MCSYRFLGQVPKLRSTTIADSGSPGTYAGESRTISYQGHHSLKRRSEKAVVLQSRERVTVYALRADQHHSGKKDAAPVRKKRR